MKKIISSISLFIFLAIPVFAQDCPYDFKGFVAEVKDKCTNYQNIAYCEELADQCGDMTSPKDIPASFYFMNTINGEVMAAMFGAGLNPPLYEFAAKEEKRGNFYSDFLCDMVINHARGILPTSNFKAIHSSFMFGEDDFNYNYCSFTESLRIFFRPNEIAALLNDRALVKHFNKIGIDTEVDTALSIPPDVWLAAYYPTNRSIDVLRALNNPSNIVMINKNTDFSFLMPKGTQILLIGEVHHAKYYKAVQQIIASLNKKPGLTHFASEFLMEMQEADIAAFRRTNEVDNVKLKPNNKNMTKALKKVVKEYDSLNMACLSAVGCNTDILALEKTERVLGCEEPDGDKAQEKFCNLFNVTKKDRKNEEKILELIRFNERVLGEEGIEARNREWAEDIHQALYSFPSAKLLAYMGKLHMNSSFGGSSSYDRILSLQDLLSEYGYKIKTLSVVGGKYGMFPDSYVFKNAGLQDKYFIFIVPKSLKNVFGADFILNIPTTGEQEREFNNILSSYKAKYY